MKIVQYVQGGVIGVKVIQCNIDFYFLQMMQNVECQLFIDYKCCFGDFKFQQIDWVGGMYQDFVDFFDKVMMV